MHACYVSSRWRTHRSPLLTNLKRVYLNFSLRGYKSPVLCRPQDGLLPRDYCFFDVDVPCDDVGFGHALIKGGRP